MKVLLLAGAVMLSASFAATAVRAQVTAPDAIMLDEDKGIEKSLSGKAGDVASGRKLFASRKLGNCLACHINTELNEQPFHGEVGPDLAGVSERYSEGKLRAIIVNSKSVFEDSIMPSFYRLKNGARTAKKFKDKTILSAQQVEDVVAYISTLK